MHNAVAYCRKSGLKVTGSSPLGGKSFTHQMSVSESTPDVFTNAPNVSISTLNIFMGAPNVSRHNYNNIWRFCMSTHRSVFGSASIGYSPQVDTPASGSVNQTYVMAKTDEHIEVD